MSSLLLLACSGSKADTVGPVPGTASDASAGDATTSPVGACAPETALFGGEWKVGTSGPTRYFRHDVPAAKGLVIALHGTNGAAESVATKKIEWQSFHAAAAARSLAILVPESEERAKPRQWDNSASRTNPDLTRIASLVDAIRDEGAISKSTPIYVVGMSQGGGVAPIFGQLLQAAGYPVRAVAAYCAGGSRVFEQPAYDLPTIFNAMSADSVVASGDAIEASAAALRARGVDADSFIKPVERVCPERFVRIPGIDANSSRQIFDGLVASGSVRADGTVMAIGSDRDDDAPLEGVPTAFADRTKAISEQLQVVAAQHAFYGDRNDATLTFFAAHP